MKFLVKNQNAEKTAEYLLGELENRYRNAEIASLHGIVNILISKKGTVTIKEKKVGVKRANRSDFANDIAIRIHLC